MATGPPILTQNARYAFGSEDSMLCPSLINKTHTHTHKHMLKETLGSMLLKKCSQKIMNLTDFVLRDIFVISTYYRFSNEVSFNTRHV